MNSITLLCGEFNNAHLDTSFASIDPKIMKLHPIEGTYPESENCTIKSHWSQTCLPCMVMTVDICLDMFMFLLLFTTIRGQDVKKSISTVTIKFSQRNLLVMWLNLTVNWPMFQHFIRLDKFKLQTILHQILNIFNHSASLICICLV